MLMQQNAALAIIPTLMVHRTNGYTFAPVEYALYPRRHRDSGCMKSCVINLLFAAVRQRCSINLRVGM